MRFGPVPVIAALLLFFDAPAARSQSIEEIEHAGDVLQIALPVTGLVSTFFVGDSLGNRWDRQGTKQMLLSFTTSWATTYAIKYSAAKLRPNEVARNSFPSGHTMGAFVGASFIASRYGPTWGVPAYGAAVLTGYSRVASQWHFADDVVAGASIAMLWNWYWVTPHHSRVQAFPEFSSEYTGIRIDVSGDGVPGGDSQWLEETPRYRYEFTLGPAYIAKNEVTSPDGIGTAFDLAGFDKRDNPTSTAGAVFDWIVEDRTTVTFMYQPFESRDTGTFSTDVQFAGETFPADTEIKSSWRLHDLRMRWKYDLLPDSRWGIQPGLGLFIQQTYVDLQTEDGLFASASEAVLLPFLHLTLDFRIAPRWAIAAAWSGIKLVEDLMLSGGAAVRYRASRHWDFSLGYSYYERDIETTEITNHVLYDIPFFSVARSW